MKSFYSGVILLITIRAYTSYFVETVIRRVKFGSAFQFRGAK